MAKKFKRVLGAAAVASMAFMFAACGSSGSGDDAGTDENKETETKDKGEAKPPENADYTVSYDGIKTATINAGVSVHDPSILQVGDTYYIYGSHMSAAKSTDLRNWTKLGDGYDTNNPVYGTFMENDHIFDFAGNMFSAIPTDNGGTHVWAPDVYYNEEKQLYYMYFCTSSTWNASNLCYATSKSPEGPFEWQGAFIYSGYNEDTLKNTDILDYVDKKYALEHYISGVQYNFNEYPNAIDPTIFHDKDGKFWMVYGSWSGGIYLLEIDEETGKLIRPEADEENGIDPYYGKRILGGGHTSMEAPYILYDEPSGYYYLYVSYGSLNREGGYQIRVFRSDKADGDYVDMSGNAPYIGKGNPAYMGLKLSGNYMLPSLEKAYMATGHNSAFIDEKDGKRYIVYHTRFDDGSEYHEPRVHQYLLNEDAWPCMLPYATDGETVSETGYAADEVAGEYYVINQGMGVDAQIASPFKLIFTEDGGVFGNKITGTWESKDGSYYVTIKYDKKEYKGVFCAMNDEAGTAVMTFSAVGSNESIWGVKY